MTTNADIGKPFTGWHMLAILVAFFSVIIGVNFLMAYYANSTWSGLVVENSYVASQEFNATVEAVKEQDARGWVDSLGSGSGKITFTMKSADGAAVSLSSVRMVFRRPVTDRSDMTVDLAQGANGVWEAARPLADGVWIAEIDVTAPNSKPWRDTKRFAVKDGVIRATPAPKVD